MAFDISKIQENFKISVNTPQGDVSFHCRRFTSTEQDTAFKRARGKSGSMENPSQFYRFMFLACVEDWEGFEDSGKDWKCTRQNKEFLLKVNHNLCSKVIDELTSLINSEQEVERGN